jgi:hypothetical protein
MIQLIYQFGFQKRRKENFKKFGEREKRNDTMSQN